jgi:excisionase family DNA binding protein
MTTATPDRIVLSDDDATVLSAASRLMGAALDHSRAHSVALVEEGTDGDIARIEVPPATLRVLARVLAMMASQQVFLFYPADTELTTRQAADLLGVSRPFLIARLEAGDLPFRKVGRHRRMRMDDVVADSESIDGYDL